MTEAFDVKNLSFKYSSSDKLVIEDLSLKIYKGQKTCIVGSNGSGKTTLVKLLAGILSPTGGSIEKAFEFSAMVFQNPENQFVSNIVEEDVAFGPENLNYPVHDIRRLVDSSLKTVGMFEKKNRAISSLSMGEKQRVALAGALALSTDCIILDEPVGVVSVSQYETVVCVSQDINTALKADRILVMSSGKIVEDLTPDEFVEESDKLQKYGLLIPENIKLIKLLNKAGLGIKVNDSSAEKIVEKISKRC